ncbi:MAG: alanine--tRNA ligase [Candidatus Nomurabacteria bacterium]|nr:alanine--tRNA ligase [Candidatus Nomurabacteria bacterium]
MNAKQIRQKYIDFMIEKGHSVIEPAPLVLEGDPTTLFTGSGMQPLMPYLLGKKHPKGTRLVNSQPCVRAQDIEDVGDNRHTTSFEMLGNWSLGDYFKEDQIRWVFEFLTREVGLDPNKIYVSCFIGDDRYGIPRDDEAAQIWQKVFEEAGMEAKIAEIGSAEDGDRRGIKPGERIFFYDDHENWWSRGGGLDTTPIGDPCGPDSELFYDFGEQAHDTSFGLAHPASDSGRFIEIGNQVFMQYRRLEDGSFEPLKSKNVDFGGGLERIAAAAIDAPDVFKTSLFTPVVEKLEQVSGKTYGSHTDSMRVIADHIKGATFLASQGLKPSNKEQGYVMRRLVRRAIRKAFELGIEQNFLLEVVPILTDMYADYYPAMSEREAEIIAVLEREERAFRQTLRNGLKELRRLSEANSEKLSGGELFVLYDTYGFPVELSTEEAFKQGIELSKNWRAEFDAAMQEQRERSQTAVKGMFKGGLEDHGEMTTKYHSVAHLTLAAMHKVLGPEVEQKGSNITAERMRFDFSWPEKLTPEQIKAIEDQVNTWIASDLAVMHDEYDKDYAFDELHAHGSFRDKYSDRVTVYQMGDVSCEICGGPHVEHTGQIGEGDKRFKITKEESSSAGVRRIKAVLA